MGRKNTTLIMSAFLMGAWLFDYGIGIHLLQAERTMKLL